MMIRMLPLLAVTLVLGAPSAYAIDPGETDARKIMEAVEDRDLGDKMKAEFTMTLQNAAGHQRQRTVRSRSMQHEGGRRSMIFFETPSEVRNTGLFSIDWDDSAKADDQWLYMPALGRTTRITGAARSGSFLGSDLSYADMTRRNPDSYDYTLVEQTAVVDGEDCWVVEATPRTEDERSETGYAKSWTWVSKTKLIPLQTKSWVLKGKRIKKSRFMEVKKVSGIWSPHKVVVRQEKKGKPVSTTVLTWKTLTFDSADVTPSEFTVSRLEQGL